MSFSKPLNCNQAVAIIRPTDVKHGRSIFRWLQTYDAKRQFNHGAVKGTIQNLSLGTISKLRLPDPTDATMMGLVSKLKQLDGVRARIRLQCQSLNLLRKALVGVYYSV
ncbi:MAG: hypothetical protein CVU53_00810 [Deltaproteobacteria bacterium HGW-Deltaproteobacteria-11]|nr:MAG: hypothetical protein CVU53_00810 [Deltaproteobacteria bacterium HGW-Deltaproteobacteria-11]